jgi:diguanylate cyclase (GGDEF)-like protein
MLGTPPEEVIGRTMREHLGDAQYQISERYVQRALAGEPQQFERSVMSPHGSIYVDVRYIPHRNAEERVDGFHVVVTDITARVEQVTALERAAKIDPLTGSANRRAFMHAVGDAVNDRRRHGTRVGLCYIDVDHFKIINDTYGHAAGDEVLRVVAQRLRTATRDDDLVGRLGGDEFVVLLGRLRDDDAARVVARKLVDAFSTPVTFLGQAIPVSISVGVALDEEGTRYTPDELLQAADCALYEVKRNGRASWRLATAAAHGPVDRAED